MKRALLFGIVTISLLLLIAGCTQQAPPAAAPTPAPAPPVAAEPTLVEEDTVVEQPATSDNSYMVEITSTGFVPKTLVIVAGDTITFVNKDSAPHWPASNMHPVHNTYPGSGLKKCGTDEQSTIFDACKGLEEGEEFTFTFNAKGTWPYHDHLHVSTAGVIIVKPN